MLREHSLHDEIENILIQPSRFLPGLCFALRNRGSGGDEQNEVKDHHSSCQNSQSCQNNVHYFSPSILMMKI